MLVYPIVCISLYAYSIVYIPLCVFHPSYAFRYVNCIVRYVDGGRDWEIRTGVGTWAHRIPICICIPVGINGDASTQSVLASGRSLLIALDYSQRLILIEELEAGQIVIHFLDIIFCSTYSLDIVFYPFVYGEKSKQQGLTWKRTRQQELARKTIDI